LSFGSLSVEEVRQDFESTMFVINIESIFTQEVMKGKGQLLNQFVTENTHAKLVFSLT